MALNEARRAVDRHMTQHVINVMFGLGSADFGTGVSNADIDASTAESAITNFTNCPNGGFFGTGATFDGRLDDYANQGVTILQAADGYNADTVSGVGAVSLTDISSAITRMSKHGYNATHLFLSPAHYENLLKMADFTAVFSSAMAATPVSGGNVMPTDAGSENPFGRMLSTGGLVGQLYGLNVVVNAWVPQTRMGIFDLSTKPMAYVERRPLTVEEANPGFGIVGSYMSMRYGLKIVRPEAGQIIISAA
jgi:hypothetical protein